MVHSTPSNLKMMHPDMKINSEVWILILTFKHMIQSSLSTSEHISVFEINSVFLLIFILQCFHTLLGSIFQDYRNVTKAKSS